MSSLVEDRSFEVDGHSEFFQPPHSVSPLPQGLHAGLYVVGACGLLSFLATLSLLSFVAYRFCTWRDHYKTFIGYNQYVLLFLNLVLADLCQGTAFLVSFFWISKDAILAPTSACQAQGFLLHLGDVASAFFVLAIALHTYYTAVMSRRVPYRIFGAMVIMVWLIVIFLTVVGLAIHQETYFVRAGAWCWISSDYEPERLGLHYFWLFLSEFGLIVLYVVTFFQLRKKTRSMFSEDRVAGISVTNQKSIDAVNRITTLMMLYPLVYVVLTLPLSAARMWSMARGGASPGNVTNCVTGALLASCGWVDCLLYTLTRERLLDQTMGKTRGGTGTGGTGTGGTGTDPNLSYSDQQSKSGAILQTTTWTVSNESCDLEDEERRMRRRRMAAAAGVNHEDEDVNAAHQQSSAASAETDAYSDAGLSDDLSAGAVLGTPARSKSEVESQHHLHHLNHHQEGLRDRSPSPTGSVDPIIARERKEQQHHQQQSGVSRVLSSATRKRDFAGTSSTAAVGGEKGYEMGRMQR
jgi:hypothetical protein